MLPDHLKDLILENHLSAPISKVNLDEILEASENFPVKFPIDTARCKVLQEKVDKEILEENINSTYPLLHEDGVKAFAKFIHRKKRSGCNVEKEFYKDFTVSKLVEKFLDKRAVVASGYYYYYIIVDGKIEVKGNNLVQLNEFLKLSDTFPIKFPKDTARCKVLKGNVSRESLEENINSAYPLVHENCVLLYANFIHEKKVSGSDIEKEFYKDFTFLKLVQRLLEKRAVYFYGKLDKYQLLDGMKGNAKPKDKIDKWEDVGTPQEKPPLVLQNCLSYDEMKLSAFLSISSFTHFVNSGNRRNLGKPEENRDTIEDRGVVVGLIGPRFSKPSVMDHQDVVFSQWSVRPKLMTEFYDVPLTMGLLRSRSGNCFKLENGYYFDNDVYKKRLTISFDTFLIEANQRAKDKGTFAYVHLVGIGLGVWMMSGHQDEVFLTTFAERLEELGPNLHNTSDIRLGYFRLSQCGKYSDGDLVPIPGHPKGGIKVHFSKEDPHIKLKGDDEGKLLVVSFAWDSNSLPGNEYWGGSLHTSSDPAAACSTQVAELHNAHINPKCSAENLHIATKTGVVTFAEYQEMLRNN